MRAEELASQLWWSSQQSRESMRGEEHHHDGVAMETSCGDPCPQDLYQNSSALFSTNFLAFKTMALEPTTCVTVQTVMSIKQNIIFFFNTEYPSTGLDWQLTSLF